MHDAEYVTLVKNEIQNVIRDLRVGNETEKMETSKQMLFEVLKLRIRGVTISYCSKKKQKMREQETKLEAEIERLNGMLGIPRGNEEIISNIESCKEELKVLRENKIRGILLRARAQNYMDFEKPTRFFCNLEKKLYK